MLIHYSSLLVVYNIITIISDYETVDSYISLEVTIVSLMRCSTTDTEDEMLGSSNYMEYM